MPTENTHLYFADRIAKMTETEDQLIKYHLNSFYLGSIFPDAFYWTSQKSVQDIFSFIHKSDGKLLKNLIFDWLDFIKINRNEKELVFLLGFLTHCVLDSVFHPAINAIAGNVFDKNPEKMKEAIFMHGYMECYIDNHFNQDSFFRIINISDIKELAGIEFFSGRFGVKKVSIYRAFRMQRISNLLYKNKTAYYIISFLKKFNMCPLLLLSYFDEILSKKKRQVNHIIKYRDPITGKWLEKTFGDLFIEAESRTKNWLNAAIKYFNGNILREECEKIMDVRNLINGTI
jgi:hypothetical protein